VDRVSKHVKLKKRAHLKKTPLCSKLSKILAIFGHSPNAVCDMSKKKSGYFNKLFKQFKKKVNTQFPSLSLFLNTKVRTWFLGFKNEKAMMKGKDITKSKHPTIVLFTAHKCASTYTSKIFQAFAEAESMPFIDFPRYFIFTKGFHHFGNPAFMKTAFKPTGYYYGAFRGYKNIPDIEKYRIVLILRDPRDVITSHYFSTAFSHPVLSEGIYEARQKALQQTIDEFVLENAPKTKKYYAEYCEKALNKENILFLKYEDMISDFEPWLHRLTKHLGMEHQQAVVQKLVAESKFTVKKEDKFSHIRSIKAGDYLDKLQPETIRKLNEMFKEELEMLSYNIEATT
jgi:hypothetical protein